MLLKLGAILALLVVSVSSQAQTWTEYRSTAGQYRIEMPGPPKLSQVPIALASGGSALQTQAISEAGRVAYLASHIDFPNGSLAVQPPQQVLVIARDGAAKGSPLLRDRVVSVAGYPGREYIFINKSNLTHTNLSVLRGDRLYQIIVVAPDGDQNTAATRRFIDSFELNSQ